MNTHQEIISRLAEIEEAATSIKKILDAAPAKSKQHDYYYTLWHNMEALYHVYGEVLDLHKSNQQMLQRIDILLPLIMMALGKEWEGYLSPIKNRPQLYQSSNGE